MIATIARSHKTTAQRTPLCSFRRGISARTARAIDVAHDQRRAIDHRVIIALRILTGPASLFHNAEPLGKETNSARDWTCIFSIMLCGDGP